MEELPSPPDHRVPMVPAAVLPGSSPREPRREQADFAGLLDETDADAMAMSPQQSRKRRGKRLSDC